MVLDQPRPEQADLQLAAPSGEVPQTGAGEDVLRRGDLRAWRVRHLEGFVGRVGIVRWKGLAPGGIRVLRGF